MTEREIYARVDHTLLKQTATWLQIERLCGDAIAYGAASVCIPPCHVRRAKEYVGERMRICTVIGFPNGNTTARTKAYETWEAVENGADEIDMVINVGMLKDGDEAGVLDEIRAVRAACPGKILKVIIETCLLTQEEKIAMCRIVTESGADYIKTSTGFSTGGATHEDVRLLRAHVGADVKVKAAGGIRDMADARAYLADGADRLGTSRLIPHGDAGAADKGEDR